MGILQSFHQPWLWAPSLGEGMNCLGRGILGGGVVGGSGLARGRRLKRWPGTYTNLGILYKLMNDHANTLRCYEKMLAIRRHNLGDTHPDVG